MAKKKNSVGRWAIIKDGVVVNVVMWDGDGDIFKDYTIYNLPDDSPVGVGYLVSSDGTDDYVFSAPVEVQL